MAITEGFEKGEPTIDDVQHSYDKAVSAALYIVESLAREALHANPELTEFVMAMGTATFYIGKEPCDFADATISEVEDFISDWDDALGLTGHPMRFTATGPVVREW